MPVPTRGISEGFAERNKLHGCGWSQLNDDEKLVFSETYFFALANVQKSSEHCDDGGDDDEVEEPFDEAKLEVLKPIYQRLVDEEKVRQDFGDASGIQSKAQSKKALKMIKDIATDVRVYCLNFNWKFV